MGCREIMGAMEKKNLAFGGKALAPAGLRLSQKVAMLK